MLSILMANPVLMIPDLKTGRPVWKSVVVNYINEKKLKRCIPDKEQIQTALSPIYR